MPDDSLWGIPMHGIGTLFIYIASFFSLYSAAEYSAKLITKIRNAKAFKKRQQT
jgi:CDP-diacylglycerol--glycerol-3-phosphate 3-phosphatidyltransferase